VRSYDNFRMHAQRSGLLARRFHLKDVQCGPAHLSCLESLQQSVLVHDAPAGAVHDAHTALGHRQGGSVHDVVGFLREGRVYGDKVCCAKELFQRHRFNAQVPCGVFREYRVVSNSGHAHTAAPFCDFSADLAHADHSQGLTGQLQTCVDGTIPATSLQRSCCLRDVAGE
jgi:hypothetical protein